MEVNLLTRWESVGQNLFKLAELQKEIRLSKIRSHARLQELLEQAEDLNKKAKGFIEEEEKDKQFQQPSRSSLPAKAHHHAHDSGLAPVQLGAFILGAVRRFGKGFAFGFGGNFVFGLLGAILKFRGLPGFIQNVKNILTGPGYRYGLFLGTFLSVFESFMRFSRFWRPFPDRNIRVRYRSLLAGSLAAGALWFVPKSMRLTITTFFFVRAMEILIRHLAAKNIIPTIAHGDTLAMCLASCQIIWAGLHMPETLLPSYYHFLKQHADRTETQLRAFSQLHTGDRAMSSDLLEKFNKWAVGKGYAPITTEQLPNMPWVAKAKLACHVCHPGLPTGCHKDAMQYFIAELRRAVPVYVPVYLIPLFVFKFKSLYKSPAKHLMHAGVGIARSSLFLSTYCMLGFWTMCNLRNVTGSAHQVHAFIGGMICGLAVLIEQKQRRLELALYVSAQAVYGLTQLTPGNLFMKNSAMRNLLAQVEAKAITAVTTAGSAGNLNIKELNDAVFAAKNARAAAEKVRPFLLSGEFAMFALSMAIIMHAYINKPIMMRASYFSLFRFFFGSGGKLEGFPINHALENAQDKEKDRKGKFERKYPSEKTLKRYDDDDEDARG